MEGSRRATRIGIGVGLALGVIVGAWWLAAQETAGRGAIANSGAVQEREAIGVDTAAVAVVAQQHLANEDARIPAGPRETIPATTAASSRRLRGRIEFPTRASLDPELVVALRIGVGEGRTEFFATPNALGRFEFEVPSDGRRAALDLEHGYHYLSAPLQVELDGDVGERELVLEPRLGARLLARLVATDGSDPGPFAGFTLRVLSQELPTRLQTLAFDEHGRVRFDGLPAESLLLLTLTSPGYALRSDLVDVPLGLTLLVGREREVELPIERAVVLAGTVRSPDGTPLARAQVSTERHGVREFDFGNNARTDDAGRFELRGLLSGARVLSANHDGFLAIELDLGVLRPGEERTELEIVLGTGSELEGRLLWPDGTPAQGIWVYLADGSARLRTDDDGRFSTAGLDTPGPFEVRASARPRGEVAERLTAAGLLPEGGRMRTELQVRRQDVFAGERDLVLVLSAGETLRGRVVDPAGRPLGRARIMLKPVGGEATRYNVRDVGGSFVISGLEQGRYTVAASAGAGLGAEVELELPQRSGELVLFAPLGASVAGRVTAGGAPVNGATVHLRHVPRNRSAVADGLIAFEDRQKETRCDELGRFEFPLILPGEQALEAGLIGIGRSATLSAHVGDGETLSDIVLELEPLGWIEGRLADGIEPRAGREIIITDSPRDTSETVHTNSEGRFEVPHLRWGLYSLELRNDRPSESGDRGFDLPVRVEAGRAAQVVLAPPQQPVTVRGRVADPNGPAADLPVRVRLIRGPHHEPLLARTDEQGTFTLELPRSGRAFFDFGLGARGLSIHVIADQPQVELAIQLPGTGPERD